MKRRKGKNLAIGILCCMLVFMGIGYAALSQVLKVTTTGNVTGQWKIYIDSADLNTETETDTNKIIDATKATSSISSDKLTATTNVSFNEPGEYALYDIVVKNEGNIDAELKNINLTTEANLDNFDVETIGLGTGTKNLKNNPTFSGVNLLANNELSFQLKITFDKDKNLTELPSPDTEYKFTISMNYVQKTSNTSGGGGGTTDDPNAPDFTVDDMGKIVAYNSSKITENNGYLIVPATNSEGKTITSIGEESFAKPNVAEIYYSQNGKSNHGFIIYDSQNYEQLKQSLEKYIKANNSNWSEIFVCLENDCNLPADTDIDYNRYYFDLSKNELTSAVKIKKLDLTQAVNLRKIEDYAFSESPLISVLFNDGLETIGEDAFSSCQLENIDLPKSLTTIGAYAFDENPLKNVTILGNITSLGDSAFGSIENLTIGMSVIPENGFGDITNLHVLNTVTSIDEDSFGDIENLTIEMKNIPRRAFYYNSGLKKVTLEGVESIGESAFEYCQQMEKLVIPNSVIYVGHNAFSDTGLGEIEILSKNLTMESYAFGSSSLDKLIVGIENVPANAFSMTINDLVLLDTVKTIGYSAFNDVRNSVVIPSSVKEIGGGTHFQDVKKMTIGMENIPVAIANHHNLETLELLDTVRTIGDYAFDHTLLTELIIPNGVTTIGRSSFQANKITKLMIPSSVTTIGDEAFSGNLISNLSIESGVTEIGLRTFAYNQITNLSLPNSLIEIGQCAFEQSQISNLTIPNSVQTIGNGAFKYNQITSLKFQDSADNPSNLKELSGFENNLLTSVVIPNNVSLIGYNAFLYNKITNLEIPSNVEEIASSAFSSNQISTLKFEDTKDNPSRLKKLSGFDRNQISNVTIPQNVITINGAFYENRISSITIPNSVQTIGNGAFATNQISNLEIPSSVTTIGDNAFYGNQITSLKFQDSADNPSNLKELSGFENNLLTSVVIPKNVSLIGYSAFRGNQIANIIIPSNVVTIGGFAFSNNLLNSVEFKGIDDSSSKLNSISNNSFENNKLTSVIIPQNVINIESSTFAQNPNLTTITIKRSDSTGITLGENWKPESTTVVYDPS